MISVLATVELQVGCREAFLSEFRKVVPLVRQEAGCIEYFPAIDLETGLSAQPPLRADVVVVIEKWSDLDALRAHLIAPHMQEYRQRVKQLVLKTTVHVLQSAE
ncbi:MAG: antibiotic biosynthesis monooxygenase [Planctomycetes bacterium]|nr:antibiotic biosynthesis monooxygenase [Planctomycetota bacterium]